MRLMLMRGSSFNRFAPKMSGVNSTRRYVDGNVGFFLKYIAHGNALPPVYRLNKQPSSYSFTTSTGLSAAYLSYVCVFR
jgi:hypothetical protein